MIREMERLSGNSLEALRAIDGVPIWTHLRVGLVLVRTHLPVTFLRIGVGTAHPKHLSRFGQLEVRVFDRI